MEAFDAVLPSIIPSSKREGFATVPDTTWRDVGALEGVREELEMAIVEPIKNPERFKKVGITAATGVLLWGPPGCGKTLLAKAVAAESKANFISVKGPELLNKVSLITLGRVYLQTRLCRAFVVRNSVWSYSHSNFPPIPNANLYTSTLANLNAPSVKSSNVPARPSHALFSSTNSTPSPLNAAQNSTKLQHASSTPYSQNSTAYQCAKASTSSRPPTAQK
jgi:hypothetical protein